MECSKYQDGCQEGCHNFKLSHTDKMLFTRIMILNNILWLLLDFWFWWLEWSCLKVLIPFGKDWMMVALKIAGA